MSPGGQPATSILGMTPLVFFLVLAGVLLVGLVVCGGVLAAVLFPAFEAPRAAAQKDASKNNLKNLGMGIHNYCADHREQFPTAVVLYGNEKPRLSWRVHLLPYIEQRALYEQFHLGEPWDSEHNKKLIERMPGLYAAPTSHAAEEGKTVYLAVTGEDTAFQRDVRVGLAMSDGTSYTIMLVEVSDERAVTWTKPDDWEFNPNKPLDGLMGQHPGVFLVLFADVAVFEITPNVDPEKFRRTIYRNDGQLVDRNNLDR